MTRVAWLALSTTLFCSCLQDGALPVAADEDRGPEIELRDFRSMPKPRHAAPRRPVIALLTGSPLLAVPDSVLLMPGAPQDALAEDLGRPPLRAEHRDRSLSLLWQVDAEGALLIPEAPLAPATEYTVAVATWARAEPDRPVTGAQPLLWTFRTAEGPGAGAQVVAAFPADGSTAVGTNLDRVVVALDGAVEGAQQGVWLQGRQGLAVDAEVSAGLCDELAPEYAAPFCIALRPTGPLAPLAAHHIVVGREVRDSQGAPVGPWQARFDTATGGDHVPPALLPLTCALDEEALEVGCALIDDDSVALRVRGDEPLVAALAGGPHTPRAVAARGAAELLVDGVGPRSTLSLRLQLRDVCGNQAEHSVELTTRRSLASLAMVELRPDPLGSEPHQEFVELLNHGSQAAALRGFSLDDRVDQRSMAIEQDLWLAPGARALLVPEGFAPEDPRDIAPPPGVTLIRMGRALASGGLANSGEALFLRDAEGRRVSAAPAMPRPRPGVCLVRVSGDMRSGAPGSFDHDPDGSCTPGR